MKAKTVAALMLISVSSIVVIMAAVSSGIITVKETAGVYQGTLKEGSSYLPFGGEPTVELIFEDNRKFTAPEQLAIEAQMKINGTYQITFNITDPGVALTIRGVD